MMDRICARLAMVREETSLENAFNPRLVSGQG